MLAKNFLRQKKMSFLVCVLFLLLFSAGHLLKYSDCCKADKRADVKKFSGDFKRVVTHQTIDPSLQILCLAFRDANVKMNHVRQEQASRSISVNYLLWNLMSQKGNFEEEKNTNETSRGGNVCSKWILFTPNRNCKNNKLYPQFSSKYKQAEGLDLSIFRLTQANGHTKIRRGQEKEVIFPVLSELNNTCLLFSFGRLTPTSCR